MLWFKHICHSTSDRDMVEAIMQFGGDAYYVFFNTLEILSREDSIETTFETNIDAFKLWFPKISVKKMTKVLQFFAKKKRFFVQIEGKKLSISCSKLLELSRLYKKKRTTEGQSRDNQKTIKKREERREKREEDIYVLNTNKQTPKWRQDFDAYIAGCDQEYNNLINNEGFIKEREKYHPNLNIKLSLEKAYVDFWGTEAGWRHKKKSKANDINWKMTFTKALDMKSNHVYKSRKDNGNEITSFFSQQGAVQ